MTKNAILEMYKGQKVRLIIIDGDKVRPRDGVFLGYDNDYIFLQIDGKELPTSFLRESIKRIEDGV